LCICSRTLVPRFSLLCVFFGRGQPTKLPAQWNTGHLESINMSEDRGQPSRPTFFAPNKQSSNPTAKKKQSLSPNSSFSSSQCVSRTHLSRTHACGILVHLFAIHTQDTHTTHFWCMRHPRSLIRHTHTHAFSRSQCVSRTHSLSHPCMRHPRSLIRHTHTMHAASSFTYSPYTHTRHTFLVYAASSFPYSPDTHPRLLAFHFLCLSLSRLH
jgi:hypothetical protein